MGSEHVVHVRAIIQSVYKADNMDYAPTGLEKGNRGSLGPDLFWMLHRLLTELQIEWGIMEIFKDNFSYFSTKIYVAPPHLYCLSETVLMMGHNMFQRSNMENYPFYPFLSGALY